MMNKKFASIGVVGLVIVMAFGLLALLPTSANHRDGHGGGPQQDEPQVTICHATNSATNPYTSLPVNQSAVDGIAGNSGSTPDHYGEHTGPLVTSEAEAEALKDEKIDWGDIIPPLAGVHEGRNWTTAGQAIYNNGCNYVVEEEPQVATCTARQNLLVTNFNEQGFNYSPLGTPWADTRADGRYEYVDGALLLETLNPVDSSSTNKVSGVRAVSIPLAQYGGSFAVDFDATYGTIEPGINVRLDHDNNPATPTVTLVAEPNVPGYLTFWTNTPGILPASLGGQGGAYAGDQQDVLDLWPNAVVVAEAFVLGSGVGTDGNLISWSTPCNTYTYDYIEEEIEYRTATATVTIIAATCETPGRIEYGENDISNATFSGTPSGTTGPVDYLVEAVAYEGARFEAGDGVSEEGYVKTFEGTLSGVLTGDACVLGETPQTPAQPEVLPETSAATPVVALTALAALSGLIATFALGLRGTLGRKL